MSATKLTTGTLTPAYGKTYQLGRDARAAFLAGVDWRSPFHGNQYCSIRDFAKGAIVELRYGYSNESATTVTVP